MNISLGASVLASLANQLELSLASGEKPLFELRAGPFVGAEFVVLEFHGTEAISTLFRFEVTVASRLESSFDLGGLVEQAFGPLKTASGLLSGAVGAVGSAAGNLAGQAEAAALDTLLMGQPATLIIHSPHAPPRVVQGVCAEFQRLGPCGGESSEWNAYRLVIRPRFWLTTLRRNSRIFQDATAQEIVSTLLGEHYVHHRWTHATKLPVRLYAVQHQESDYTFVERLLAELGLFYFFEPPSAVMENLLGGPVLGALEQAGQAFGGELGQLANAAGLTETLVIGEASRSYLPIAALEDEGPVARAVGAMATGFRGAASIAGATRGSAAAGIRLDSSGIHVSSLAQTSSVGAVGAVGAALGALGGFGAGKSPQVDFKELVGMVPAKDHVFQFDLRRTLRPKTVSLREYDFKRPSYVLAAHAQSQASATGTFTGFTIQNRSLAFNTDLTVPAQVLNSTLEVYDHHDEYEESDVDRDHARIHLEQHRRDVRTAQGQSVSPRLIPGFTFCLEDHPERICNNEFATTAVNHWGQIPEWTHAIHGEAPNASGSNPDPVQSLNYRNTFECIPATIAFRLPRPERRIWQVTETATVVGPTGKEIYVDAFGRIKVHFHWDRDGGHNEHSSCWLRVMQPWGGPGWGHQFIPRVGMEVLVTFLGGDPDKPVVIGSLYNGNNGMPFDLGNPTRSGIKTRSTPGGWGYNELSFEDAIEHEEIRLHAEKDLNETIRNNHNTLVHNHRTETVNGNRALQVQGDASSEITGTRTDLTRGNHESAILKNHSVLVRGDSNTTVDGSASLAVRERLNTQSGGEHHLVSGSSAMMVADELTVRTRGCYTIVVGASDAERSYALQVLGEGQIHTKRAFEISSDEEIVFRVGDNSIRLSKDGIQLGGKSIRTDAGGSSLTIDDKNVAAKSNGGAFVLSQTALLKSEAGARLVLGQDASVDAKKIALNSPLRSNDNAAPPREPKPTKITLTDKDGAPLADQPYVVILKDGSRKSGVLDASGKAELLLEDDSDLYFPALAELKSR